MNDFLEKNNIDIGRSLALITFAGTALRTFTVIGHALLGEVDLDLSILIAALFGYGLWCHKQWARAVFIVLGWGGAVLISLLTLTRIFGFRASSYVLTVGEVTIKNPNTMQSLVGGLLLLAVFIGFLAILHSKKANDEFKPA